MATRTIQPGESPANPSRRGLLAAMVVAPVAIAIPAFAVSAKRDPVDECWAATFAYDEFDDASERRLARADAALDAWEPPSEHDFIRKFLVMFHDGGVPNPDRIDALIHQAHRFVA